MSGCLCMPVLYTVVVHLHMCKSVLVHMCAFVNTCESVFVQVDVGRGQGGTGEEGII